MPTFAIAGWATAVHVAMKKILAVDWPIRSARPRNILLVTPKARRTSWKKAVGTGTSDAQGRSV
jgi:hypothetical protein